MAADRGAAGASPGASTVLGMSDARLRVPSPSSVCSQASHFPLEVHKNWTVSAEIRGCTDSSAFNKCSRLTEGSRMPVLAPSAMDWRMANIAASRHAITTSAPLQPAVRLTRSGMSMAGSSLTFIFRSAPKKTA
eukprot:CAMPEP_0195037934 /NCGR_PEP_ID=MMETSP0326_2-20130528/76150_1 /TAXON_ID=2866 ORGANISM="Crypthecodinium cohnii, Strain Seligo" /NCGR_SAMPLE_ID=MMETSP0326_2 /ASSEMBLY_ACC=CAM_ASM_000348 /LENGTH=133 /DNA_ID=CAMNT_0040064177 /DNA_START=171 /DNA_END=571 /DNA_ORIENTATION=+